MLDIHRIFCGDYSVPYIHQHPDWPRFKWDDRRLLPVVGAVRLRQGRLLGRMQGLGFRFQTEANVESLTADVVKSSAIEGETFDPAAVRSSVARRLGLPGVEASSSREVEGAVEVMLDATQHYALPVTAERLKTWQAALFLGKSARPLTGAWRTPEMDPMQVISGPIDRDRVRRKNVHFEAPEARRIPREMDRFLRWFDAVDTTEPLLRAGVAHLWLVTIHPFEDGNGRVSRAIADLALARAESSPRRFYSLSSQIEAEKKDYYAALERAQKGTPEITTWLEWFLGCLDRAIAGADQSLSGVLRKAERWERINRSLPVNERQQSVLNALFEKNEEEFSTSRYAKLARCSLDTALRDVKALTDAGVISAGTSGGRSTRYRVLEA